MVIDTLKEIGLICMGAVGVVEHELEPVGRRVVEDAAAHAVEPVARLRFAGQVIHDRRGGVQVEVQRCLGRAVRGNCRSTGRTVAR